MVRLLWNVFRLVTAIAVVFAIIVQSSAVAGAAEGDWDPTQYYTLFGIQSYLIGAVVFVWAFRRRNAPPSRLLDLFRGASAVYLTVTFFAVLLLDQSPFPSDVDVPLVDLLLHWIFPVIVVADWILFPPDTKLRYSDAGRWLVYPVVWIAFTLIRGAADGWYPYPVLDPADGGYGMVAVAAVGMIAALLAVSVMYIWLANWRAAMTPPRSDPLEEPRASVPAEPPGWERPLP